MSKIFLSHSSLDANLSAALHRRFTALGYDVFLDLDVRKGIEAGRRWKDKLYVELKRCDALVILWSRQSAASRWCTAEITFADANGKQIFPLVVDDQPIDAVLLERQALHLKADASKDEIDGIVDRLCNDLAAAGIDAIPPSPKLFNRPPYPGLNAYDADDEAIFFGRGEEITAGLEALNRHRGHEHFQGLVAIVGASGVGKSSLMRAGLLPKLRRDASRWAVVGPFRPASEPFTNLAGALCRTLDDALDKTNARRTTAIKRNIDELDAAAREADKGRPATGVAAHILALVREAAARQLSRTRPP